MKLVKAANNGIVTSLDGSLYNIGEEAIEVTDEVASRLNEQFGHLIIISQKEEPKVVSEEVVKEETPVEVKEKIEEKPKQRGRPKKESND